MTKGERVAFSYGRSSCVSGTLMAPAYDGRMRSLVSESRAERGIRSNMRNMAAWYIGYACQAAVAGRGITQEQFRGMMTAVIQCDSPSNITELEYYRDLCADFGVRSCYDEEGFNQILKSHGEDAYQTAYLPEAEEGEQYEHSF